MDERRRSPECRHVRQLVAAPRAAASLHKASLPVNPRLQHLTTRCFNLVVQQNDGVGCLTSCFFGQLRDCSVCLRSRGIDAPLSLLSPICDASITTRDCSEPLADAKYSQNIIIQV